MITIEESLFDEIIEKSVFENINEDILANPSVSESLKKYLALTQYPERFINIEPLDLFYNRYYWYLKFLVSHQKVFGYDAGLEQQEFRILEEGEKYSGIDWGQIEKISNELKNESSQN